MTWMFLISKKSSLPFNLFFSREELSTGVGEPKVYEVWFPFKISLSDTVIVVLVCNFMLICSTEFKLPYERFCPLSLPMSEAADKKSHSKFSFSYSFSWRNDTPSLFLYLFPSLLRIDAGWLCYSVTFVPDK